MLFSAIAYFVGSLYFVLVSLKSCSEIHEKLASSEIHEIFGSTSIPSYEIAEVWHSQTARNASNEIILKSYGKEIKLYLQPAEGFLFGEGTPVWLTYRKKGKFIHSKLNNFILKDAVKFWWDPQSRAAIVTMEKDDGLSVLGTIANRTIRSLPDRFTRDVMRKKRDLVLNNSLELPNCADPNKNYTMAKYHVLFATPTNPDDSILSLHRYNFTAFNEPRYKRDDSSAPKVIYPEILIVMDYAINITSHDDPRLYKFLVYVLAFWHGVDLRFRELKKPEVRLQISGIIIARNRAAVPWMKENTLPNGKVRSDKAMYDVVEHVALFSSYEFPPNSYDIVITMTNQLLCVSESAKNLAPDDLTDCSIRIGGSTTASLDTRCSHNLIIIICQDLGNFEGIPTTVHEIGHGLGAVHDGKEGSEMCSDSDGYIMSSLDLRTENNLVWSECSRKRISMTASAKLSCMRNSKRVVDTGSPLPILLPGEVTSIQEICRARGWEWACEGHPGNCKGLRCWNSGFFSGFTSAWSCYETERAPEGSICDLGKICLNGECVDGHVYRDIINKFITEITGNSIH